MRSLSPGEFRETALLAPPAPAHARLTVVPDPPPAHCPPKRDSGWLNSGCWFGHSLEAAALPGLDRSSCSFPSSDSPCNSTIGGRLESFNPGRRFLRRPAFHGFILFYRRKLQKL